MVWPGGHGMGKDMAWRAWHSIWYGLTMHGLMYLALPGGHGMVYGMAWWAWHGICYGLAGITWYRVWSGEANHGIRHGLAVHGMVYGMAWWA